MGKPISTTKSGPPLSRRLRRRPTSLACESARPGGETKLFRDGDYPVLRGTALLLDERTPICGQRLCPLARHLYWARTPNPLFVTILRSKNADARNSAVLADIMGLTKINYNSCNYNDGLPVTVRFARMVGEVLTKGLAKGEERQPFKYYI